MPKYVATGYRIGIRIMMAAMVSIKHPVISRTMFTTNKNTAGLLEIAVIHPITNCGICSTATSQAKRLALAAMNRIIAV